MSLTLNGAFSAAASGLANVTRDLAVVSQNVSNANTPGYTREIATQTSLSAGGAGMGVKTGIVTRADTAEAQSLVLTQNAAVAALQTRQTALQAIDAVQGTPGQGTDLSSLLGNLQDSFSSLATDPSNQTQQSQVADAASIVAGKLNTLSTSVQQQRKAAQDGVVSGVAALNASLAQIGTLSQQIVQLKSLGQSTADLENQRDAAISTVSGLADFSFFTQSNGDMLATTPSGLSIPLHGAQPPFSVASATMGASSVYPGTVPAVTLNGADVTTQIAGGAIGANITLRDQTLPGYQAQLDEFAESLSTRFDQQGLTLFTQPNGTLPPTGGSPAQSGYLGYAGTIQLNPAVSTMPSLIRDGTSVVAGSATGASAFTPNPAGGAAGFSTLISRVLTYTFGNQVQSGMPQAAPATTGLGAAGTISAPYTAPATLADFATSVVAAQASDSNATTSELTTAQSAQTSLAANLASVGAVSIDQEMSHMIELQTAYGANAKIVSAVQAMWNQLLQIGG
jgi:flagellar hook-associated protein 1 FlgK